MWPRCSHPDKKEITHTIYNNRVGNGASINPLNPL